MKTASFAVLLAATAISVGAAAYAVISEGSRLSAPEPSRTPLFADLLERSNDVQSVVIADAKGKLTLLRQGSEWTLAEAGGYRVPADKVRQLVGGLAGLRLMEPKTDQPARHARLEVEDVTAKDAKSRQVTLLGGDGKALASLIVGKPNRTLDLNGLRGVYVRSPDEPLAWLAEGTLEVPTAVTDWVDRAVIDLPASKLKSATFEPVGADKVILTRAEGDAPDFTLAPVPEGRTADPDAVMRLAEAFSAVSLDDVRADKDTDKAIKAATVEAVSSDGLTLQGELLALDGATWLRVKAKAEEGSAAGEDAKTIDARVTGWLYKLPQFKAGLLQPKIEDYLKQDEVVPSPSP